MPRSIPEGAREHADLALAVYVEELAARRRVLFVGDAGSAVPERLAEVARSVDVVSPRSRARGTRRGGRIQPRPWPSAEEARSWDLVVVPDLSWTGPPGHERLGDMADWLAARGVLIVGAESREGGLTYESLYELLSLRFESVRMLGQAPFAGWAVVDFAPRGEPEVTFDGSLLGGGEEPLRYLAVCGAEEVVLDPYAVIQVPFREPRPADRPREDRPREDRPRDDGAREARLAQLEAQVRDRDEALERARGAGETLEREATAVRARVEHAERRLEQAQREITRGTQRLDEARARADALAAELEGAREKLAASEAPAGAEIDEEYSRLEASLVERAKEIAELRAEVERRGTLARDLVEEVRELRARPPSPAAPADRSAELERALEAARRRAVEAEASVAEAGFRMDELKGALALAQKQQQAERELGARQAAAAQGTVRGLVSRLAEAEELRKLTEARLALAQDDVGAARARAKDLERALEDARDQVRSTFVRPPAAQEASAADAARSLEAKLAALEAEASEREGRLYGALLSAREGSVDLQADRKRLLRELSRSEAEVREASEALAQLRSQLESRLGEVAQEAARALEETERAGQELTQARSRAEALAVELSDARGEVSGLRLRLADAEAALEARPAEPQASAAQPAPPAPSSPGPSDLLVRIDELHGSVAEWTRRASESAARAEDEARRAAELGVRLATRDVLVARLQSELSESASRRDALDRKVRELEGQMLDLREQLDAAKAVADVRADQDRREAGAVEERLARAEKAREEEARAHEETRRTLLEARQILGALATGLETAPGSATVVGMPADPRVKEDLDALRREAEDRELMMRSLTAQLQDRDDRIRALERLAAGEGRGDDAGARMLLAEERSARFERELEQERAVRRAAESQGGAAERDAELRRLHQLLGDRDAGVMVLEGRIGSHEREVKAMKDVFAQARSGLEQLLGDIAGDRRAEAADRIATILRALRRY